MIFKNKLYPHQRDFDKDEDQQIRSPEQTHILSVPSEFYLTSKQPIIQQMGEQFLMILKKAVLLLLLLNCSDPISVRAQSKSDSLMLLSMGVGGNIYSVSSNPVFIPSTAIPTFAQVGITFQQTAGDFRRPQDFQRQRKFGFGASGLSKVENFLFLGSFSYGKNYRDSIRFANIADPYGGNPFITADAIGGNWQGDGLDASLQIVLPKIKKWQTAIRLDYGTEQNSRDNDPKPLNRVLKYSIQPSAGYTFVDHHTFSILAAYSHFDEMIETGYYADQTPTLYSIRGYGEFTAGPVVTAQRFTKGYGYRFGADYLFKDRMEFLFGLRVGYLSQDVNDGVAKPIFVGGFDEHSGEAFASYSAGTKTQGITASAKAWFKDGTGFDPIFNAVNPAYYFSGLETRISFWKQKDSYTYNLSLYPALSYTNFYEGIAKTDWTSIMLHQDAGFSVVRHLSKQITFGGEFKIGYHPNLQKEIIINRPTQLSPILVTPYYQFASTDYFKGVLNITLSYQSTHVSYQIKTGGSILHTKNLGNWNNGDLSLNLIF